MPYENYSPEFQEFYYWCISEEEQPKFARARNDVPFDLVTCLTGEELETAKQLIFQKFDEQKEPLCFFIRVLAQLGDPRAIPYIQMAYRNYKEWHGCPIRIYPADFAPNRGPLPSGLDAPPFWMRRNCSMEKKLCKNAIESIKKAGKTGPK